MCARQLWGKLVNSIFWDLCKTFWQGSTTSDMVCTQSLCRPHHCAPWCTLNHFPSRPKQGHILAPTLFTIYLAVMLNEVPCNSPGVDIHYHLNGSRAKTLKSSIKELQYADKYLCCQPPTLWLISEGYYCFGMEVNVDKTKILAQPDSGQEIPEITINIRDLPLELVNNFQYFGNTLIIWNMWKRYQPPHQILSLGLQKTQQARLSL